MSENLCTCLNDDVPAIRLYRGSLLSRLRMALRALRIGLEQVRDSYE
jgi:hypothetical protein